MPHPATPALATTSGEVLGYVLSDPSGRYRPDPEYPTPEAARDAVRGQPGWRVGAVAADGSVRFDDAA